MSERTDVAAPVAPAEPMPTTAGGPLARFRSFARRHKEFKRFSKFAIVGALGFVIDWGTVNLLLRSRLFEGVEMPLPIAGAALTEVGIVGAFGFIFAVTSNFIWNRLWTYPDSRSKSVRRQLALFAFISVIGWLGRTIWISLAYEPLGSFLMPYALPFIQLVRPEYAPSVTAAAKLGTFAAMVVGVVVVMFWNFFANRLWTYNDV